MSAEFEKRNSSPQGIIKHFVFERASIYYGAVNATVIVIQSCAVCFVLQAYTLLLYGNPDWS